MTKINLEDFVNFYIEAVFDVVQESSLNSVQESYLSDLDFFYEHVFNRVSQITGFSKEKIISLHHPFHWSLFLKDSSPLKLVAKKDRSERGYEINVRNAGQEVLPMEKSALVSEILREYGILLQQKIECLLP